MELSGSNIFSRESFSYISGNGNPEKTSYIFPKESFSYISRNRNPEKILYISGNGTFLYFRKLLVFQKVTFRARKMKKLLIFWEMELSGLRLKNFL